MEVRGITDIGSCVLGAPPLLGGDCGFGRVNSVLARTLLAGRSVLFEIREPLRLIRLNRLTPAPAVELPREAPEPGGTIMPGTRLGGGLSLAAHNQP